MNLSLNLHLGLYPQSLNKQLFKLLCCKMKYEHNVHISYYVRGISVAEDLFFRDPNSGTNARHSLQDGTLKSTIQHVLPRCTLI